MTRVVTKNGEFNVSESYEEIAVLKNPWLELTEVITEFGVNLSRKVYINTSNVVLIANEFKVIEICQ
jgi:hypothetical protein